MEGLREEVRRRAAGEGWTAWRCIGEAYKGRGNVGAGGLRKWDGRGSGIGSTGRGEAPTERCMWELGETWRRGLFPGWGVRATGGVR